jgi:hypothetical protein
VPFDVDCPDPLQNLLHCSGFVLLNMDVLVSLKNQVDPRISESPTHKTANAIWFQCLYSLNMIGVQLLVFKSSTTTNRNLKFTN